MNTQDRETLAAFRISPRIAVVRVPAVHRLRRKQRFGKHGEYQAQRVIEGFYYYLHPEEVGDRSQGWRMFARDHPGEL